MTVSAVMTELTVLAVTIAADLAVTTVAVIVAVFTLRHVDTIEDDTGIREFAFGREVVQDVQRGLRRIVGATDKDGYISLFANLDSIGYETDRGRVEDDIVIKLSEDGHRFAKAITRQEFRRIRRDRTSQEQVQIRIQTRSHNPQQR